MWNEAATLGQLRDAVAFWIDVHGENCRVGIEVHAQIEGHTSGVKHRGVDDAGLMMEWVWVDRTGKIVGTEGEDHQPADGEMVAIVVQ